ncbi:reverse transcriptase domain, Reverse transcriptase zinc-binding domain protein [Artemisia annua]|uniref:Reverse transcriptase domain, Reverse transcriptase zinc-binding domain protein n=1 Tax=Artemisia annua TaxID=35608 RepID=A0A2U1MY11_ARTAN|nr:reverse transcriptase domain, Reverse transcriptase zinc-binding domain protein [Artemisia annua]
MWSDLSPLRDMLTPREIVRAGLSLKDSVYDVIENSNWKWPAEWLPKYPTLFTLPVPTILHDTNDTLVWRDLDGNHRRFSVACAWESLRTRADVVEWFHIPWFSHCIPRQAIHLWLVIRQKLKTQDRLRESDVGPDVDLSLISCLLCETVPDTHPHLFFECPFSMQVWFQVRGLSGMDSIPPLLEDVITFLIPISKGRSVASIISRLILAATTYDIWLERNTRLFKRKKSAVAEVVQVIVSNVRLKLVTFKFKKLTLRSRSMLDSWKIPSACLIHEGRFRYWIYEAAWPVRCTGFVHHKESPVLQGSCVFSYYMLSFDRGHSTKLTKFVLVSFVNRTVSRKNVSNT